MQERPWHKHYAKGVNPSIEFDERSMARYLSSHAAATPDKKALIFQGASMTYGDLDGAVNRFSNALLELGVKKGDRVALLMPNIPQFVIACYSAWKIGAVVVPHNPLYTDDELEYQLNNSESTVLVTLDLLAERMIKLRARTGIRKIIVAHIRDYLGFPLKQLIPLIARDKHCSIPGQENVYEFMDLIKQYPDLEPVSDTDPGDLCLLMYTGGTTGVSKGVMLTHENISKMTQIFVSWFTPLHKGEVTEISSIPFFHVYGLGACMDTCIIMGWTNVLIPRPEAEILLKAIHKYKPRFLPTVPTLFIGMMNHPKLARFDLSSIDVCLSGASPLPAEIMKKFESMTGSGITEFYGMTEMSAGAAGNPVGDGGSDARVGSVGIPLSETDLRIVDIETGTMDMPAGEAGEIILRGPQLTQGYYNMPEETAHAIRDGWLYTGDIGRLDDDNYLYVIDRKKDMIIASGYNIYPRDIDEVLFTHPEIASACAVGVPDEYRGETVKAFVVLEPGASLTEEDVISYCREKLAVYKVPKIVEFIDALPTSSAGKILRKELRAMELEKINKN